MALPIEKKTTFRRPGELVYGTMLSGAITNTDYDLVLPPGRWAVALFINADGVSAGTITARPLMPDGAAAEADAVELLALTQGATVVASVSLIDFTGSTQILASLGNTPITPPITGIVLYGGIRFTVASIAGASATNRIWFAAVQV